MKKLFTIAIIVGISIGFLPSCNNSDPKQEFQIKIATMNMFDESRFYFLLDDGRLLLPVESAIRFTPRDHQRVILNFTTLSDTHESFDNLIRINDLWSVLTKQVVKLTPQNAHLIGDDRVIINDIWEGGDFLNVSFRFNWGGFRPHYINLVKNTMIESTPEDGVIELEFRHNAYGSINPFNRDGLVSFDLRPFQVEGKDKVTLAIRVREPSGIRVIKVEYHFNQATPEATANATIPPITSNEVY